MLITTTGARIGFFCNHHYAHSQSSGRLSLPGCLKGVDLAVFASFKALGLSVVVSPVMKKHGLDDQNWGGRRIKYGDVGVEGAENKGVGAEDRPKTAPQFDAEYIAPGRFDSDSDADTEMNYEEEEDDYYKGTVVGTTLHGPFLKGSGALEDMGMDDETR